MAKSRGFYLRFPCPECGASQKVLPAQAGTELRCSECPAVILVPTLKQLQALSSASPTGSRKPGLKRSAAAHAEEESPSAPPREVKVVHGHMVSFACPACHAMMRASQEEVGHMIMCPNCYSPITVGGESKRRPPADEPPAFVLDDSGDDDDEYRLSAEDPPPKTPPPVLPKADKSRSASKSAADSKSPAASSNHRAGAAPEEDDDELRLSDPEERPTAPKHSLPPDLGGPALDRPAAEQKEHERKEHERKKREGKPGSPREPRSTPKKEAPLASEWDLAERNERPKLEDRLREEQEARAKLDAPRPFVASVFGFLFDAGTLPYWISLAFGTMLIYYLAANFIHLMGEGGDMLFYAVICAAMSGAGGLVLVIAGSVMMLAVLQDTAAGSERVHDWPDYVFLDWVGQAFYVINALAFGALPGFVLASMLLESDGDERWFAAAASAVVLFPIFLLSALDNGSPFAVLSSGVLKSMASAPAAWLVFYLMAAGVLAAPAAIVGLVILASSYYGIITAVIIGVLGSAVWLILGRLLGRLAWYCEEKEVTIAPAEDEAEKDEHDITME